MTEASMTDNSVQPSGPSFPPWVFKWIMNPAMKLLLRSPLHKLVSERLLLLTFTGRKSGREYTTPLGYEREGETLVVMTRRPWWKNFEGGAPVTVRLQGQTVDAIATAVMDRKQVADYIRHSIQQNDAEFNLRRFGLTAQTAMNPDQKTLLAAAEGQHMIKIELKRS